MDRIAGVQPFGIVAARVLGAEQGFADFFRLRSSPRIRIASRENKGPRSAASPAT